MQFSHFVVSDSLWPRGLQHARLPCPSPTRAFSNSCPLSRWCHSTISFSVVPFTSCLQSFPASGSFPVTQFFASGGQSIGVSALTSVLPMNIQDWYPLRWTGWISLQSKGLFFCFLIFIFTIFYFTILYWYCRTLTWICYGCKWVPNPEPPSNLPPHIISLDHPRAPAYTPRDS